MKFKVLLAVFSLAILVSCSSDEVGTPMPMAKDSNYFPLNIGNSWTYNNNRQLEGETAIQSKETMKTVSANIENGTTFYDLSVDKPEQAGLTTSIFSNGKLTKRNGELIYTGNYKIIIPGYDEIELPIAEVVVFNSWMEAGTALTHFSNSVKQDLEVEGQIVPISINYTVSTTNEELLPTYNVGTKEYEDVLQANFLVTASVMIDITPMIQLELMKKQDVVKVTNYYASEVGLIYSNATINYEFETAVLPTLPTIPSVHIESSQEIDSYIITGN